MSYNSYMYNKLFTKILDSSIWLEDNATRIVWLTLLAAMDEDGMCQFASIHNLGYRARVTKEEAVSAVTCLESPDPDSSDTDFEGRRIERVPGGWMVLNGPKYRDLVTREIAKEKTRIRVANWRKENPVTPKKRSVTLSEAVTETKADSRSKEEADFEKALLEESQSSRPTPKKELALPFATAAFREAWEQWEQHRTEKKQKITPTARKLQLSKLEKMGETRAIAALQNSTLNGYQGIFEPSASRPPAARPVATRTEL